jgi:hypothetical protein
MKFPFTLFRLFVPKPKLCHKISEANLVDAS